MKKISAVYKIMNTVTGEFYIGSSRNAMHRWAQHKCPYSWKKHPNNPLYQDFQKYGVDKFRFQILCPVMEEYLKQVEQELIEMLKPTYNDRSAKGVNAERRKEACRKSFRMYYQSDKGKETHYKVVRKYKNRLCSYNGETLTLNALSERFRRKGLEHPVLEAKKCLLDKQ